MAESRQVPAKLDDVVNRYLLLRTTIYMIRRIQILLQAGLVIDLDSLTADLNRLSIAENI